jgi:hypothetical protein
MKKTFVGFVGFILLCSSTGVFGKTRAAITPSPTLSPTPNPTPSIFPLNPLQDKEKDKTKSSKGPHGGQVVTHQGKRFEIKLDPQGQKVEVFTPGGVTHPNQPISPGITLYKSDKTGETVKLNSMAPPRDGWFHYQGQLSPTNIPYVAFGLQFDLSPIAPSPSPNPEDESP